MIRQHNRYRATVEPLEERCLLAGLGATFFPETGVLQVKGTAAADQIVVTQRGVRRIRVVGAPIRVNGLPMKTIGSLLLQKVEVFGRGGDDVIDLRRLRRPVTVRGGPGHDLLRGGTETDDLDGGLGTDRVYGGRGNDKLQGGPDGAVLFGGPGRDRRAGDPHRAGPVPDRLLRQDEDLVTQAGAEDAILWFDDSPQRAWSEAEVLAVDEAFARLQERTRNNRLLKLSNGGELHFLRQVERTGFTSRSPLADNNDRGRIRVYDRIFANPQPVWETIVHEIGHNWDDENPYWTQFNGLSGWTQAEPQGEGFRAGRDPDERWWHRSSASFATTYARWNPREDFAESFAAAFGGSGAAQIPAKLGLINSWLDGVTG